MLFGMTYVMSFAFALSLAVSGFMIRAGVGDVPNARSNHSKITPTCGGLGVTAGLAGLFFILPHFFSSQLISPHWPAVLAILWGVSLLGLIDDIFALPALVKFAVLLGLAALAVWVIGPVKALPYGGGALVLPYALAFAGSVLWIFVCANGINFIDGSNGLMASTMIIACLGLVYVAKSFGALQAMYIPAGLAAGLLGFLPYNLRRTAHIFSGDVGSLTVGFSFAVAVLWLCAEVPDAQPVFIGPVLLLPLLTDVFLTMLRRLKHKENLLTPHKTHLYQRLIAKGYGHIRVALFYSVAMFLCALYAYLMIGTGSHSYVIFLGAPTAVLSVIYYLVSHRI